MVNFNFFHKQAQPRNVFFIKNRCYSNQLVDMFVLDDFRFRRPLLLQLYCCSIVLASSLLTISVYRRFPIRRYGALRYRIHPRLLPFVYFPIDSWHLQFRQVYSRLSSSAPPYLVEQKSRLSFDALLDKMLP